MAFCMKMYLLYYYIDIAVIEEYEIHCVMLPRVDAQLPDLSPFVLQTTPTETIRVG